MGKARYRFEDCRVLFQDGDVDNGADENAVSYTHLTLPTKVNV